MLRVASARVRIAESKAAGRHCHRSLGFTLIGRLPSRRLTLQRSTIKRSAPQNREPTKAVAALATGACVVDR